jgi:hypothetical protein
MARRWGRVAIVASILLVSVLPGRFTKNQTSAASTQPIPTEPIPPGDPEAVSTILEQGAMTHVFDTSEMGGGPYYVNDHAFVQGTDGAWHMFGIFHHEPIGEDTEFDFIHAVAKEPDPARWKTGAFNAVPSPFTMALRADRSAGETHVWAPHVVFAEGRWWMFYQGGGPDGDHSSIRLAESDDLYRWERVGRVPVFEDFCVARDPMLVRREGVWALYYTRCATIDRRASGVAVRQSKNLVDWTEPRMVLTLSETPSMWNSGYTESPFVFQHDGFYYLSVSAYPIAWDATLLYRSRAPFAFPSTPISRLRAHAGEWLTDRGGKTLYLSHAGPGQSGVWIGPVSGL